MTRDQYGISAPVSQWRETDGSVAKCGLFSQAIISVNDRRKCLLTQGFYRTKLFVDRPLSVDRPLFQALSDGSKLPARTRKEPTGTGQTKSSQRFK